MKTTNLIRWNALAALASGVLWVIGGILTLAYPQAPPDMLGTRLPNYLGTFVFSAAYLGVLGAFIGLRARQVDSYGNLGEAGFYLAFVGAALLMVAQASSAIFAENGTLLGWLLDDPGYGFMVAINLHLAGLVVLGVATLRARVLPRWCGLALIGVVVVSIFGAIVSVGLAFVAVGLLWVAIGYALWQERTFSVVQPQHGR
jgi:hypothetical protein